jgi:hypothetical protein
MEEGSAMSKNQRGVAAVPLLLVAVFLFVVIGTASARRERRLREAADAGSVVHAKQVQAVFDNYGRRYGHFPMAAEFDGSLALIKPLYPGLLNTHSCLPTEPRTRATNEPGAIILGVASDGCSDTIRVIGNDHTVIMTIIGRIGGPTNVYGGVPKSVRHDLGRFQLFPNG